MLTKSQNSVKINVYLPAIFLENNFILGGTFCCEPNCFTNYVMRGVLKKQYSHNYWKYLSQWEWESFFWRAEE